MFDTRKFQVYAMVMFDGPVLRDVANVKMMDLQNANYVVIIDKSPDVPHLEVWKDRDPNGHAGPISIEEAEAGIARNVKAIKEGGF